MGVSRIQFSVRSHRFRRTDCQRIARTGKRGTLRLLLSDQLGRHYRSRLIGSAASLAPFGSMRQAKEFATIVYAGASDFTFNLPIRTGRRRYGAC